MVITEIMSSMKQALYGHVRYIYSGMK